ncbi:MAG: ankyrin repeat domain-containing protein [Akkermansiaceae bacterium]|nr:ankyrin repeat domain-containing protein [Akkermansiaceae bacterium]MCP5542909.1 ankyrin repeat domain-containing protein [Akkermansiaceae bacterium]
MRGVGIAIGLGWVVCIMTSTGCRKPVEAKRSELEEAGFSWTTEDWFRAARADNLQVLNQFLASGFTADSRDDTGDTALHAAAEAGAESVADQLLDSGLPPDLPGADERTPLHAAVAGDQPKMIGWLIRQGADPSLKNKDGFSPLLLAVRDDRPACVEELAIHQRDQLDDALLLAAITGRPRCIDVITNYGGSVYARMDDGRTPLMLAAENGQLDSVKLLLELGASRFSTSDSELTAVEYARNAGHEDIATLIEEGPAGGLVGLESEEEIGLEMSHFVDARAAGETPAAVDAPAENGTGASSGTTASAPPPVSLAGAVVSAAAPAPTTPSGSSASVGTSHDTPAMPPLVMRHYRESELPLRILPAEDDGARVTVFGADTPATEIASGNRVPGSTLEVLRVSRRMEDSKLSAGEQIEVSVVEVKDTESGETRTLTSSLPASAHDPLALVEDAATGRRYVAAAGQRFRSEGGDEYLVADVRPTQIVIENVTTGEVTTLPLRGPRG